MESVGGHVDWELLAQYVAGECSQEEGAAVEAWVDADPKRRGLLKELQQVWDAIGEEPSSSQPRDVDAALERLDRRIRKEEQTQGDVVPRRAPDRRPTTRAADLSRRRQLRERFRVRAGLAAAVVAVLVVAMSLLLLREGPQASEAKVFTTARGQQATIRLADGTKVHLNVESRLELPPSGFAADRREVRLEGEAYFEVARDISRPFYVRAQGTSVRVLGTAFNVQAYAGEKSVQVAVSEGEVALQGDDEPEARDTLQLRPRQLGIAGTGGVLQAHRGVNLSAYTAWTEGRLVFEDAPFDEVTRKLERWYDVCIDVRVSPGAVDKLNAAFEDEPLREVLDNIAMALDLQYEKKREAITFYRSSRARNRSNGAARPELTQ